MSSKASPIQTHVRKHTSVYPVLILSVCLLQCYCFAASAVRTQQLGKPLGLLAACICYVARFSGDVVNVIISIVYCVYYIFVLFVVTARSTLSLSLSLFFSDHKWFCALMCFIATISQRWQCLSVRRLVPVFISPIFRYFCGNCTL